MNLENPTISLDYPRPQFARQHWKLLNGTWEFAFDDESIGESQGWYAGQNTLPKKIQVPFVYQTAASGINKNEMHDVVWYKRSFSIPEHLKNQHILLFFGAVDYAAKVWLNGHCLGEHIGGYTPFHFNITSFLKATDNVLVLRIEDKIDTAQPRGKQFWKEETNRCWYTPTTGIWQSVWLEGVKGSYLEQVHMLPDIDTNQVNIALKVDCYNQGDEVEISISYQGIAVKKQRVSLDGLRTKIVIALKEEDAIDELHYWSPDKPNLYDIHFTLYSSCAITDEVTSYFGFRHVGIDRGCIMINHEPCMLNMILDQGYWADTGLTPPDANALISDIKVTKAMGFNGVRKHQKLEDPRYLYWADKLGLLVWGEIPSAYEFCADEMHNLCRELGQAIQRDYNHPCIIAWVPLNESWGVRKMLYNKSQQDFGTSLYYLCKALDGSRLVSTNDGWENIKTDIVGLHDYNSTAESFSKKYTDEALEKPEGIFAMSRRLFAYDQDYLPEKTAFMITEWGGIALKDSVSDVKWGYSDAENTSEELLQRYSSILKIIQNQSNFAGHCYTQLTDVYQEVNGLLDAHHQPKFDILLIKKINEGTY